MIYTIAITLIVCVLAVFLHYEALRFISNEIERMRGSPRRRLLIVLFGVLTAHSAEIVLFAVGFWVLASLQAGTIVGDFPGSLYDFFYLSGSSYTTLGTGDVYVVGAMRVYAAIEALLGLVLIGWSTSFTYLAMRDFWDLH